MGAPRAHGFLWLRLFVAAGALLWTLARIDLRALSATIVRIPLGSLGAAVALTLFGLSLGATRWQSLLAAYQAEAIPPWPFLFRAYLVGLFYNTFLPANVGGDILRGHVTTRAFRGAPYGYVIVFLERVYGLSGLLTLAATTLLFWPSAAVLPAVNARSFALIALAMGLLAALMPAVARSVAAFVPSSLGNILAAIPRTRSFGRLGSAWLLSLGTHSVVALTVYVLLAPLAPSLTLLEALTLAPLALASLYLPTIAGLGVREAAFVLFFGQIGIAPEAATAASLALFAAQAVVAALGGLSHVHRPLS